MQRRGKARHPAVRTRRDLERRLATSERPRGHVFGTAVERGTTRGPGWKPATHGKGMHAPLRPSEAGDLVETCSIQARDISPFAAAVANLGPGFSRSVGAGPGVFR